MKQVEIYQLSIKQDGIFMSHAFNEKHGFEFKAANYQKKYACERPDDYSVEDAFIEFNTRHPEDFRGHSLSMSDVVVFKKDGQTAAHYIDTFGSVELHNFI